MSRILCAVRGGPDSDNTIARAIALAKKNRARLVLLYVVTLRFFLSSSENRRENIGVELRRMGEYVLLMAQAKAAREGVVADTFVRQGELLEEIAIISQEMSLETLVMGKPRDNNKENFFTIEEQVAFAEALEAKHGISVVLVD